MRTVWPGAKDVESTHPSSARLVPCENGRKSGDQAAGAEEIALQVFTQAMKKSDCGNSD